MNPQILAQLLVVYGPTAIDLIKKLVDDINSGRTQTTITVADLDELKRLGTQTAADIFRRSGVNPPSPTQ